MLDGTAGLPTLDPDAVRALVQLVGDDRQALGEIVDAFLEDAPQQLAELRLAAAENDDALARRAAHTLKANGRTFGAGRLASLCEEIETAARAGDLASARGRIDEVDEAWAEVEDELTALREGEWP